MSVYLKNVTFYREAELDPSDILRFVTASSIRSYIHIDLLLTNMADAYGKLVLVFDKNSHHLLRGALTESA